MRNEKETTVSIKYGSGCSTTRGASLPSNVTDAGHFIGSIWILIIFSKSRRINSEHCRIVLVKLNFVYFDKSFKKIIYGRIKATAKTYSYNNFKRNDRGQQTFGHSSRLTS